MRPLLVTAEPDLLDDLLRLAAAAGAEPDVADHPGAAAPLWRPAPLVLLGHDLTAAAVAAGLPRRPGLVVVGGTIDDAQTWQHAVSLGAEHVVFLPEAEPWLVERLAAASSTAPPATVVAVVGARGGAGATSFAVAYALAAARAGRRTLLVDADPLGGGIDLALGVEDAGGARWDDVAGGPVTAETLTTALPRCGEVTVLSWARERPVVPIPPAFVESLLGAARRGAEVVVVDLPRSFDETARLVLGAADVAYVVCPAEVRACAAGRRVGELVRAYVSDVRLVARGPSPGGLVAAEIAEAVRLPLAGWLDAEPGLDRALEAGQPPGRRGRSPLAQLCDRLVAS